jgi:hypothetical protein
LRQAIRLNPGSAEAYAALGRALYVAPQIIPDGIAELSRGVFLGEHGAIVQIYRAALYQRMDQLDDALNDLRQVLTNPDLSAPNREFARNRIARYLFDRDAKRLESLVREKNYTGAREILNAAANIAECEPASGDYERMRAWLDENEAWGKIGELLQAERKSELYAAAKAFVERFPRSPLRRDAQRILNATRAAADIAGGANE